MTITSPLPTRADSTTDRIIADLARAQHGVVATRQLDALGIDPASIHRRVRLGRLHRMHQGVLAVGFIPSDPRAHWLAAVLAIGDDAVLTGEAAAYLWNLRREPPTRIEVLSPRRVRGPRGVTVRSTRFLRRADVGTRDGIPVTRPGRTLVELMRTESPERLANRIFEGEYHDVFHPGELAACLERFRSRPGIARLRRACELNQIGSAGAMSGLEERFLTFVRRCGFPEPDVNPLVRVGRGVLRVDFVWREARVCVEVDGPAHDRARARREDEARTAKLRRAGYQVIRVRPIDLEPGYDHALMLRIDTALRGR